MTANKSTIVPHKGASIKGQIFLTFFSLELVPEWNGLSAGGTCGDELLSDHFTVLS